jgi:GNAT superfamily N-acetyltransferase
MSFSVHLADPQDFAEVVRIDDEATTLYAEAGLAIELDASHPFTVDEQARWLRSARRQRLFFATNHEGRPLGFAALDDLDGDPYLDQLSVRPSAMRRGIGRSLLRHVIGWAAERGARHLWLTTYGHLPWNRPFYEAEGFVVLPDSECGPGVRHHLSEQRRWLPLPDQRVAMRRALG